jgi:hypothetical protein
MLNCLAFCVLVTSRIIARNLIVINLRIPRIYSLDTSKYVRRVRRMVPTVAWQDLWTAAYTLSIGYTPDCGQKFAGRIVSDCA